MSHIHIYSMKISWGYLLRLYHANKIGWFFIKKSHNHLKKKSKTDDLQNSEFLKNSSDNVSKNLSRYYSLEGNGEDGRVNGWIYTIL